MIDQPNHVLTEGWGHIAWVMVSAALIAAILFSLAGKLHKQLLTAGHRLAVLVPYAAFGILAVLFSVIAIGLKEHFNGRPRIEYFDNGFCHYDLDGSNRFIRWTQVADLARCTYPSRTDPGGKCTNGTEPIRSAPSYNRSLHAAQFTLKNCKGKNCTVLIDSMHKSGFVDDLAGRIGKAPASPGPDRTCQTIAPFAHKVGS